MQISSLLILRHLLLFIQGCDSNNIFKNKPQSYFFPPSALPEELRFLWRQAATVTPLSGSNLQIGERELSSESADSEKEREREMVEAAEREEERREVSSKEVQKHFCLVVLCLDLM